jgi:hypothetical protein
MATRGVYHQNDKTVKRRNTIQLGLLTGGTRRASSLPGSLQIAFFLAPPESALGRPLSTVILRRSDQRHPDADDARDAEMALWRSWVRSCNRCRNWSPAWRPASSPGALACESNSDHGRASFIADGCVGAAPRQSVHIISALAWDSCRAALSSPLSENTTSTPTTTTTTTKAPPRPARFIQSN